jgi:Domain of unknown function (DUF4340)
MKFKPLAIGVLVLAVIAGAGLLVQWKLNSPSQGGAIGQPLMDKVNLDAAARIEIAGPANHTTLIAKPTGWVVQEQGDFPADQGKLSTFLLKLTEQTISDKVTENPDDFADLGVVTVEENGNKAEDRKTGTLFRILDGSGKPLYELLIGRDRAPTTTVSAYGGQYVRFPQAKAAYLIGTTLFAETDPKEWIEKPILTPETEKKFKLIRVEKTGAKPLAFSREQPESAWQLDGATQRGLNLKEIDNLSKKLRDLEVGRIAPADSTPAVLGRTKLSVVEVRTFDGRTYRFDIGEAKGLENYRYATVRETLDATATDAALKKDTDAFNGKFKDRFIAIPDWDATRLLRERKEYLQSN